MRQLIDLVKKKLQELGIEHSTVPFETSEYIYINRGIYTYRISSREKGYLDIYAKVLTDDGYSDEEYLCYYKQSWNESIERFVEVVFQEQDSFSLDMCKRQYKELMEAEYQKYVYKYFTYLTMDSSAKQEFFNKLNCTDEEVSEMNKFLGRIAELEKQMRKRENDKRSI